MIIFFRVLFAHKNGEQVFVIVRRNIKIESLALKILVSRFSIGIQCSSVSGMAGLLWNIQSNFGICTVLI